MPRPGIKTRALIAAAIAVGLMALPATATADAGRSQEFWSLESKLSVRGSHGYRIQITNLGDEVTLHASKGAAEARYTVHGKVTRDRLSADFGRLGRVSLRFQASPGETRRIPHRRPCEGAPTIHEVGRFTGTIRFDGEEDFSSVAASSAKGSVVLRSYASCPKPRSAPRTSKAHASRLAAGVRDRLVTKEFAAVESNEKSATYIWTLSSFFPKSTMPGTEFTIYTVGSKEDRGRISIEREAWFDTERAPVQSSPIGATPAIATITPPAPLEGTGSYAEIPGSSASWSGDLRVQLPGGGMALLAGPNFKAILCYGSHGNNKFSRCQDDLRDLLSPVFS